MPRRSAGRARGFDTRTLVSSRLAQLFGMTGNLLRGVRSLSPFHPPGNGGGQGGPFSFFARQQLLCAAQLRLW
jgi:hypothetical protein